MPRLGAIGKAAGGSEWDPHSFCFRVQTLGELWDQDNRKEEIWRCHSGQTKYPLLLQLQFLEPLGKSSEVKVEYRAPVPPSHPTHSGHPKPQLK